jgi:hypothetical protein
MRITPAASMTKVGKWAIMGLSQPNKGDHRPGAAGGRPRLAMRAFSSNRAPSFAFACQSPAFSCQAG